MINLDTAHVYDVETFPNVFTLTAEPLYRNERYVFELSPWRDDKTALLNYFEYCQRNGIAMIGFNSIAFDYVVCHFIMTHPTCTIAEIYAKAMDALLGDRFANTIWQDNRFAPQIDLFKINHFDNRAKTTSLKALQFNMRSQSIVDMPVEVGTHLTFDETRGKLIPYNGHDVGETKKFAFHCLPAINFRIGLMNTIRGDVLNFSDVKIGAEMLIQRIGDDVCYDRSSGRRQPRQTVRSRIPLRDIIFPYVQFHNPEFARVLDWMKQQVLTSDDLDDPDAVVKTKGVFTGVTANINGLHFHFGTGGMHASVPAQRIVSDDEYAIIDDDVEGYYPSLAVANGLAPAHLGEAYTREYAKLKPERKEWQKKKGKKCVEANALKLASNGPWGQSNNAYTVFFDTQYAMTIPINGQLLLCMLVEWISYIPSVQIIQANTDGITYRIKRSDIPQLNKIRKQWEEYTCLTLEQAEYKRMWIRDVNNYVAENMKGELKQKGAYWHPDPLNYSQSISEAQPPAWHKDLSNCISIRAAVAHMVHGVSIETFIKLHSDPFDFMIRAKVNKDTKLILGSRELQKTSRYYVAINGEPLKKVMPAAGRIGAYKKAQKVSDAEYHRVMAETNWQWDARVCTKNRSKYEPRESFIQAGWKIAECNDAADFNFRNLNYDFYIAEAVKLVI